MSFFNSSQNIQSQNVLSRCKNFLIRLSLGGYRTFAVHHEESLVPVFFKFSIDHSLDNIESGKNSYCFRKNLDPRVCSKPVIVIYFSILFC